ncbi:MAG: GNAT family N-acetyltransferase [Candidatus Krumholzibacteria bacterium]|nr:GNAT family N-acetyltransferase [Candidatus Krumholzibacteria bacterium]
MIPVTIRPYLPEDGPGVIVVVKASYDAFGYTMDFTEFDSDLASIPAVYRDSGGEFWILEEDGLVAGCVGVTREDAERCELHRLYLLPSHRGRGLGRQLVETVIAWCRENGCREIVLWSDIKFEAAREVYIRCGFSPTQKTRAIDPVNPGSTERYFTMIL